jgi:predicted nucleotidyltransferase component of viral defense system
MDSINYKELFKLQDKVLGIIFSVENEFYLTGGTCLSRFYHEKRYSDDLDFFTHNSGRFSFAVKNIKVKLQQNHQIDTEVDSKNFIRFKVDKILQIDFVNDTAYRYKDPVIKENGYIIDSIENILSNKITAVIGRDNPKDIFDIYLICRFYDFDWKEILGAAQKKSGFMYEDLIVRLKSFPFSLLKTIRIVDDKFLDNFENEFPIIIEELNGKKMHFHKSA